MFREHPADPTRYPRVMIRNLDKLTALARSIIPRSGRPLAKQEVPLRKQKNREKTLLLRTRSRILRSEQEGAEQHTHLTLCIFEYRAPLVFSGTQRITIAFRYIFLVMFLVLLFEVEQNLHVTGPTLGVRKSASVSCHTWSSLSFTSQILTAQFALVTLSSTGFSRVRSERRANVWRRQMGRRI